MKIESKEKLAKLLAIEDLDIQHQQVQTAMFDLKNRCLILPVWKDMPNHLYDLFVGHEVGHALFTPATEKRLKAIIKKTSKDCVNVIEDARIESLIKRRYPGLRKQFHKGYNHLIEKDFFGLEKRDINDADFLDRINIHFKIPQYGDVLFNKEEQKLVDLIEKAKSFLDVEKVAVKVHAYCKKNDKNEESDNSETGDNSEDKVDGTGESQVFNSESNEDGDSGESESVETESTKEESNEPEQTETEGEEENSVSNEEASNSGRDGEEEESSKDKDCETEIPKDEVVAKTQRHFDERVKVEFVDSKYDVLYVNVPEKINEDRAIDSYKDVHKNLNRFYQGLSNEWSAYDRRNFDATKSRIYGDAKIRLQKLKKESVKTVNHIAMEFERKKAADIYKKTLVTKSGVLDTNKMFSAKYNEDVFKKNTRIPEGKNHGLVMFIDWSGSMACSIGECIKQVIELSFFCKKVNIPFDVYSFSDRYDAEKHGKAFDYRHGDFVTDKEVRLRNYLSSRMNNKEYNNALLNLIILAGRFNQGGYQCYPCPSADELSSTPLNGAILLSEHVIRDFKKRNNLESVHAVWLTDGEGNRNTGIWNAVKNQTDGIHHNHDGGDRQLGKLYLKDKKTKKDYLIWARAEHVSISPALFDMVKDRLGINVIGFFILPNFNASSLWRFSPKNIDYNGYGYGKNKELFQEWTKKIRKDGFFVKTEAGYDEYYVLNNKPENKPVADIDEKMTTRKMVSLFSKKNSQFKVKRVILSRFVDLITAKK